MKICFLLHLLCSVLFGLHSLQVTEKAKKEKWLEITNKMNAFSTNRRNVEGIREHFRSIKLRTKAKAAEIMKIKRQTGHGGDSLPELDQIEEIFLSLDLWEKKIIKGEGLAWVNGIEGGIDSSQQQNSQVIGIDTPLQCQEEKAEEKVEEFKPKRKLSSSDLLLDIQKEILDEQKKQRLALEKISDTLIAWVDVLKK